MATDSNALATAVQQAVENANIPDDGIEANAQTTENAGVPSATVSTVDQNTQSQPTGSDTQQTTEATTTETQVQQQTQEPTAEEVAERDRAVNIYRMLNDPQMGPGIVKMLAEQLGIPLQPSTPETKPPVPSIKDIITQHLGEEHAFLAPALAPAVEKAVQQLVQPIQRQLMESLVQNEYQNAISQINTETQGDFKKHEPKIVTLMDQFKPGPNVPIKAYLTNLYTLAKATVPTPPPARQVQTVVQRMVKNAQERLPSPSAATESKVVKGPALPTLEEAVMAAIRGEKFE
jgi:DNA primase